jgi:hypothetical protein
MCVQKPRCQRHSEDQVFACYEAAVDVAKSEEQHAEQTLKAAQQWKAQIQVGMESDGTTERGGMASAPGRKN